MSSGPGGRSRSPACGFRVAAVRPMKHGAPVIAFVEDPDGYKIEFIQKKR